MITDLFSLVVVVYLAMTAVMAGLWALQLRVRNASIADVAWCVGLIAAVLWYAVRASGDVERKVLISLLAVIYAGRLGAYLLFDRIVGRPEDARYRRLRARWGEWERLKMFAYFHLQAIAVAAFSLPFLVAMQNPRPPFGFWELGGVIIWIVAVCGEAAADRQLSRFRSLEWTRDRVCRDGLWYYSRHPNYFFEWLHWWSYVVMAVGSPGWPLTLIGPVGMGWALLRVTGIPVTEEQTLSSRGEEYRIYQQTTNAFVPWIPKRHMAIRR